MANSMATVEVAVVTQKTLKQDKQQTFDMLCLEDVPRMIVRKDMPMREFRKKVAQEKGLDPEKIRFWGMERRKNQTIRVSSLVLEVRIGNCHALPFGFIALFAEISDQEKFYPVKQSTILLFFKYFDLQNQQVRHVGHGFFESSDLVEVLLPVAKKLASLPDSMTVCLFEEVTRLRVELLSLRCTLLQAELIQGDIIIVDIDYPPEWRSRFDVPDKYVFQFFKNQRSDYHRTFVKIPELLNFENLSPDEKSRAYLDRAEKMKLFIKNEKMKVEEMKNTIEGEYEKLENEEKARHAAKMSLLSAEKNKELGLAVLCVDEVEWELQIKKDGENAVHYGPKSRPLEHTCPITQEVMTDPVIAMDGNTYERKALEEWFNQHDTSPLTNLPLPNKILVPNISVRNMIENWGK